MKEIFEKAITALKNCPNLTFTIVNGLQIDSREVEGGRCMIGNDIKLCFSEQERGKIWKNYLARIINEENGLDHNVEAGAVEGPVVCV